MNNCLMTKIDVIPIVSADLQQTGFNEVIN
jgi:hypothetical protein